MKLTKKRLMEMAGIVLESDYNGVELHGSDLSYAYYQGDWDDVIDGLIESGLEEMQVNTIVDKLKQDCLIVSIDLGDENPNSNLVDSAVETLQPIAALKAIDSKSYATYSAKGYKYFTLLPVDYNRGTFTINLALAKSDKELLSTMVGEY